MNKEEARLQAKIVIDFSQKRPEEKGRLIGYFAETENKIEGATKLSLGLVRGASDLFYIDSCQRMVGIEIKAPGSRHNVLHLKEQAFWLMCTPYKGFFCDSLEMFWDIINNGKGISPKMLMNNLNNIKTATVSWDEISKNCLTD